MLRSTTAKKLAASWHGGQWSALYQFASSGTYVVANHLRYLQEVQMNIDAEYFSVHEVVRTKKDENELNNLKTFFEYTGKQSGIGTEYGKHSLYGYSIPYVTENTPDELANQVTPLSYPK